MVHNEDIDELREIVRADLAHLRDTWHRGMDSHVIRREAPLLRRLLIDDGGDLAKLWKAEGRSGQPTIPEVFDLDLLPTWRGLAYATADTIRLGDGLEVGSLFMWRDDLLTDEMRSAMEGEAAPHPMALRQYLEATCLVVGEKGIRRDDLICYIANRRGGNHLDRRGKKGNPRRLAAYDRLDELSAGGLQVDHQDGTFGQLVAVVRNLLAAPDIVALSGLGEEPGS